MGLLDSILGSVMGGGQPQQAQVNPMANNPLGGLLSSLGGGAGGMSILSAVMGMVQQQGGLGSLLDKFRQSGLGQHADSWVSTGPNMPIDANQLHNVLGSGVLGQLAAQLGMQPAQAQSAVAAALPQLVNHLTPNGALPDNHGDLLADGMKMLQGMLGR